MGMQGLQRDKHTHIDTHTDTQTHRHTHIHAHTRTHTHTHAHAHTHTCTHFLPLSLTHSLSHIHTYPHNHGLTHVNSILGQCLLSTIFGRGAGSWHSLKQKCKKSCNRFGPLQFVLRAPPSVCDNAPTDFVQNNHEMFSAFSTIVSEQEASKREFFDIWFSLLILTRLAGLELELVEGTRTTY